MFKKKPNSRPQPLPEGWEAKKFDGETVYVNHVTKETQWDRPTMGDATRHNAFNATRGQPSGAPVAYMSKEDGPAREVDGSTRKPSSSRRTEEREELPYGERATIKKY
eukprot:g14979.t1